MKMQTRRGLTMSIPYRSEATLRTRRGASMIGFSYQGGFKMPIRPLAQKSTGSWPRRPGFSVLSLGLFLNTPFFSQLPTASEIAGQMTIGWNIGNSLEVPSGETGWGNPRVDQELIDAVSDAGFNTIRIPCAWDSHANKTTLEIDPDWLDRVAEVVDYCHADNLFV